MASTSGFVGNTRRSVECLSILSNYYYGKHDACREIFGTYHLIHLLFPFQALGNLSCDSACVMFYTYYEVKKAGVKCQMAGFTKWFEAACTNLSGRFGSCLRMQSLVRPDWEWNGVFTWFEIYDKVKNN